MILSVHQPQYLPWLGYFDKIKKSDCFVFLDTVQYKPREFQNRNKIRTKDGELWLTVPVISKGQGLQSMADVHINNESDWYKDHWGSLKTFYSKALFFKDHCGFFEGIYTQTWDKLVDLNIHIIKYLLEQFQITTPLSLESEIRTTTKSTDRIIEICQKVGADTYLSGQGGKDYMEVDKFGTAGIKLIYQEFKHPEYQQLHTSDQEPFRPYLAAIDLLFNEGHNSVNILKGC